MGNVVIYVWRTEGIQDEFICNRVLATQKRPTRDLLERFAQLLPKELERVMKRHEFSSRTQTDVSFKESALRMNIIRKRTTNIDLSASEKAVIEVTAMDNEDATIESALGQVESIAGQAEMQADKEVFNDENNFVLYLEVIFTSPQCSTKLLESHGIDSQAPASAGGIGPAANKFAVLPLLPSLNANRALRRKTWYEHEVKSDDKLKRDFTYCAKLFRDLAYRWPNWQPLETWHIFQVCYIALKGIRWQIHDYKEHVMLTSVKKQFTVADSFRRCLELIGSGFILTNGTGIIDPCETGDMEVFNDMTIEMRNSVTLAAQTALRCMNYGRLEDYLSDPEALMRPDANRFGYEDNEDMEQQLDKQMQRDMAQFTGQAQGMDLMQTRVELVEEHKDIVAADELIDGEHRDEVDNAIDDFMKDL